MITFERAEESYREMYCNDCGNDTPATVLAYVHDKMFAFCPEHALTFMARFVERVEPAEGEEKGSAPLASGAGDEVASQISVPLPKSCKVCALVYAERFEPLAHICARCAGRRAARLRDKVKRNGGPSFSWTSNSATGRPSGSSRWTARSSSAGGGRRSPSAPRERSGG